MRRHSTINIVVGRGTAYVGLTNTDADRFGAVGWALGWVGASAG